MKKSKFVSLVLITSSLASCSQEKPKEANNEKKVYMRSDSTASYSHSHCGGMNALMWYYAFRPYGYYGADNSYHRTGFYSGGISDGANMGSNAVKGSVARGGFGKSSFSVSS